MVTNWSTYEYMKIIKNTLMRGIQYYTYYFDFLIKKNMKHNKTLYK